MKEVGKRARGKMHPECGMAVAACALVCVRDKTCDDAPAVKNIVCLVSYYQPARTSNTRD